MQLIITETVTQQFGVDADNDEAALKALDQGNAAPIPGSRNLSRRVNVRPQPAPVSPALAARTTPPTQP